MNPSVTRWSRAYSPHTLRMLIRQEERYQEIISLLTPLWHPPAPDHDVCVIVTAWSHHLMVHKKDIRLILIQICAWVSISAPGQSKYFLTNNDEGQTGPMLDQFFLRSGSQALQGSEALTGPGSKEKVVLHAKFHHSCNKSYPRTTCIVILTWSVG